MLFRRKKREGKKSKLIALSHLLPLPPRVEKRKRRKELYHRSQKRGKEKKQPLSISSYAGARHRRGRRRKEKGRIGKSVLYRCCRLGPKKGKEKRKGEASAVLLVLLMRIEKEKEEGGGKKRLECAEVS